MGIGGAQGLEHGPFPQNIARLKKRTTTHTVLLPDPDLVWSRKNRLVEGTYEVTATLVQRSADVATAVSMAYLWTFSDADPDDAILAMTGSGANLASGTPIQQAVKIVSWVGDGNTQLVVDFDADDEALSVRFAGVLFVPAPTDVTLSWGPSNVSPADLLATALVRFQLVR